MAVRFPNAWVDDVYSRSNIVDVVSAYVSLKKQGHNHWGLCPFHHEKNPSFSVNPETNVYYCFGCKAGGNVVQFVMAMEKLTYQEALLQLANRMGLQPPPLQYESPEEIQKQNLKERIYEANKEAARFYHENLWKPQGKTALEYLNQRGVDDESIRQYGLGTAFIEWTQLSEYLIKKGFSVNELDAAGLIHLKEGRHFDAFRNRVMFPIMDIYGHICGFGGRSIDQTMPKYLNTRDTLVFNKRFQLYGVQVLKKQKNLDKIILVEGYMDVISLSRAGVQGVTATLGTAMSLEQARLMKRFAPEIWIAYDGDEPGQNAISRAIEILEPEEIPSKVLVFPEGLDPDDFIRQKGLEGFEKIRPIPSALFRLERLAKGYHFERDDERNDFLKKACALVSTFRSPIEQDYYLSWLSKQSGVDKNILLKQLLQSESAGNKTVIKQGKSSFYRKETDEASTSLARAEQILLSLLSSGHLPDQLLKPEDFDSAPYRKAAQMLLDGEKPAKVLELCDSEQDKSELSEIFSNANQIPPDQGIAAAEECLLALKKTRIQKRISSLRTEVSSTEGAEKTAIMQEILQLQEQLKQIPSRH